MKVTWRKEWVNMLLVFALILSNMYIFEQDAELTFDTSVFSEKHACIIGEPKNNVKNQNWCAKEQIELCSTEVYMEHTSRASFRNSYIAESFRSACLGGNRRTLIITVLEHSNLLLPNFSTACIIRYIHNQDGSKG